MATETRTSEQGRVFDAATVRDFLLIALGHNAVIDQVDDMLFEHVMNRRYHPAVIATHMRSIVEEVLGVATFEDWNCVTSALIADARETIEIEIEPPSEAPGVQPPRQPHKRKHTLRSLDSGELREKLAEIYTHDYVSLGVACRAQWIIRRISKLTGVSREQIQADAKADAEAIAVAADDNTATADQSSAHKPAHTEVLEVTADLPQVFVRPLAMEAYTVARLHAGKPGGEHPSIHTRTAILLASDVGCPTSLIAAMLLAQESDVRKVIADFNERGMTSLDPGQ